MCSFSVQMRGAHQRLVVVGQMHETGETLPQSHRIENGEFDASRRHLREQPRHHHLRRIVARRPTRVVRLQQQ